jgi:hypothetical protein
MANLTPLALATLYALARGNKDEDGNPPAQAPQPQQAAPTAPPPVQLQGSPNAALDAGQDDYGTTGNVGKAPAPVNVKKKPTKKKSAEWDEKSGKAGMAPDWDENSGQAGMPPPRVTNALGMTLNQTTPEGLARMRERDKKTQNTPDIGDNISKSLENLRNRFKENTGLKKGGEAKGYAKGGQVSAGRRGDGIATKGHTKGRLV